MPVFSKKIFLISAIIGLLAGCRQEPTTLFSRLPASKTGVDFKNMLREDDPAMSIMTYPYFYNGGGVGVGDFNRDGLPDLFFTGNMVPNQLYINKGNFKFENVSAKSGIGGKGGWNNGVAIADVNADGWPDIYVCRSGLAAPAERANLLYISNHDLTFTESAARFGLDDKGYSTQASFFDYDKDGDLDMFLINQSSPEYSKGFLDYVQIRSQKLGHALANKLFRNDGGHFTDVTSQAGISSSVFTFSLGLSTADINQDGWPDIYVANDFEEADYLYINQRDGTFGDSLRVMVDHASLFSMGVDAADYNNDQLTDLVVLDMLPEGNYAQKMHMSSDNFNRYKYEFANGMFWQYMKNSLQRNNGDGTFSEIGQMAGVSNTDWSWSPLLADYDNDGLKDLFITNGYQRDNTDMQFMGYAMNQSMQDQKDRKTTAVQEYISHMPGIHIPNYIFRNNGGGRFENKIKSWGFDEATYAHGGAYADLDNDGFLDLITNNTGDDAGIYRNNGAAQTQNSSVRIQLTGPASNTAGFGTKVYAWGGGISLYLEQSPVRGYQSSSDPVLSLGIGKLTALDSVRIVWPDDKIEIFRNVAARAVIGADHKNAKPAAQLAAWPPALLEEVPAIGFVHRENDVNDFTQQFLLPHFLSRTGPCLAQGDVNGDGIADVFAGGAKGQAGELFVGSGNHVFKKIQVPAFETDADREDTDAAFFDADGDEDLDLYVVSGGYEFPENSPLLQDRLYLNNGTGQFALAADKLPAYLTNKKCVRTVDFDNDGDIDLFIGGGVLPGKYPAAAPSRIYFNDGKGNFSVIKPANAQLGIVNDAIWIDLDGDGRKDLIVAGEWSSLKAYRAEGALFRDVSATWFPFPSGGWWNSLTADDFDKDGDLDLIAGNAGLNSQLTASAANPLQLYYDDLDGNGSVDFIITHYIGGESVPLPMRDDIIGQLPMLKKKFNNYEDYAKATITTMLTEEQRKEMKVLSVTTLNTLYLENTGKAFVVKELPREAQESSVYAAAVLDINRDGHDDVILAGNNAGNKIYISRQDANHGVALLGDGKGNFSYLPQWRSGLKVKGDVRSILVQDGKLMFGINDGKVMSFALKND